MPIQKVDAARFAREFSISCRYSPFFEADWAVGPIFLLLEATTGSRPRFCMRYLDNIPEHTKPEKLDIHRSNINIESLRESEPIR